ncbi:transporter substrate-binding domain-containing protein [Microvirga lotononidis]|uniref:Periplasmic component of amino acid ABC-type transporter/signal transduction system n=1 Tax=Microvirga lotononidis TaxID=864069 RepID=I4YQX3_9HYPH|nr:transporter substrate-binding domain-containing protein [Microvirga lotononidis]EIM26365.1 periplasmic component of amino acid ABC-type transporter/signal transduction system [Microvirga lotononidis]WQO30731.1 transporter substrate-binding domain-containing protein [Microvirga lotononidis]
MKGIRGISIGIAFAALIGAYNAPASAKEWKEITVGVEGAFPPFNLMTADGKLDGFDMDVANEVCKRANLKCTFVAQDWDSQIPGLLAQKFDAVLTMGPNPKRREVIDFTTPYAITPNTFLVEKSGPLANLPGTGTNVSVNDGSSKEVLDAIRAKLKGKTVGVALSTSQQQFMEENFKNDAEVKTYKSSEQAQLDLGAGRIDAQFDNIVFVTSMVEKSNGNLVASGPMLTGGIMATNVCIGIRKNEPELKEILDKAIQSAAADGTLRTLSTKWFKTDVSPK